MVYEPLPEQSHKMITPEFQDTLISQNAVFNDSSSEVVSFGDAIAEFEATKTSTALFVISDLIRIRLTGADRMKFLHNFCTANVKAMATGDVLEAFLTDVKARILGHGYVAASADCVELWMLPGNADAVANHLQKYVIVEDVNVQIVESTAALAMAGPDSIRFYSEWQDAGAVSTASCVQTESHAMISIEWNGQPLVLISLMPHQQPIEAWQTLQAVGAIPAGQLAFETLRISERFPRIDVDLSNSNMAPEAGRNETAICYSKGCYLGQEPIARLDAMGHVNRQLYCGTIQPYGDQNPEDGKKWPLVTSQSAVSDELIYALAVLPVKSVSAGSPVVCQTADGRLWQFTVTGH